MMIRGSFTDNLYPFLFHLALPSKLFIPSNTFPAPGATQVQ